MPMTWTLRWSLVEKWKGEKNKTSYSQNMLRGEVADVFLLRNVLFKHGSFINFPCCICCCHSHGFALYFFFLLSCCKDLQQLFLRSVPFHVCRFLLLSSMLNISKYIFTARDMRKKKFPKTKHRKKEDKYVSQWAITTQAKLMELFISRIYNSIYVMKLETEDGKNECFMKIHRRIQGQISLFRKKICWFYGKFMQMNWLIKKLHKVSRQHFDIKTNFHYQTCFNYQTVYGA